LSTTSPLPAATRKGSGWSFLIIPFVLLLHFLFFIFTNPVAGASPPAIAAGSSELPTGAETAPLINYFLSFFLTNKPATLGAGA